MDAPQGTIRTDVVPSSALPLMQGYIPALPKEARMHVGMVGLGRMGLGMARRLGRGGHACIGFDPGAAARQAYAADGGTAVDSLRALVEALPAPRVVWLMVPAGIVDAVVADLAPLLGAGDTIVEGGNSCWQDDLRRAAELAPRGIHWVDAGVSGGVWGLERGYCLMVGGPGEAVARIEPLLRSLAPGAGGIAPSPGREGRGGRAEEGWLHCGPTGAGHFVKMVHNGIEYGLMAAYAEGFNLLRQANRGAQPGAASAESTPLRDPSHYRYDFDLADIAELWRRGSVIPSWLLDLTAQAMAGDPGLDSFAGRVSDSGEGRWTVQAAVDLGVPAHVLTASLFERFSSRGEALFADKVCSAMRKGFGGHLERKPS
jgi:6-phosphogluconate dehydrogenase